MSKIAIWMFVVGLLLLCSTFENCSASLNCPSPPSALENGVISSKWDGYMLQFHCDHGYDLHGAYTAICKNGRWNHPLPTCLAGIKAEASEEKPNSGRYGLLRSLTDTNYQEKYDIPVPQQTLSTSRLSLKSKRPLFSWDSNIKTTTTAAATSTKRNPKLENNGVEGKEEEHQQATSHNQPMLIQAESAKKRAHVSQISPNREKRKKSKKMSTTTTTTPPTLLQTHFKDVSCLDSDEVNCVFVAMNYSSIELGQLDMSCMINDSNFLPAPHVRHGVIDAYRRRHNPEEPFNNYLEAYYVCRRDYVFQDSIAHSVYCLRSKWVGQLPQCVSKTSKNQNKSGDDTQAESSFIELNDDNDEDPEMGPKISCKVNKGGCQQVCEEQKDVNSNAKCLCYQGYKLNDDQKTCSDINECALDNWGCEHQCWNVPGSAVCFCDDGYTLASDRKSCKDKNECLLNNGHGPCQDGCRNLQKGYECYCSIFGTQLAVDNHTCEDIDECASDNFGCAHSCLNTIGSAFCACDEGYMLAEDWKSCEDVDECEFPEITESCKGRCVNTVGSYKCETGPQHQNNEVKSLEENEPIQCEIGYQWQQYENQCVDIDECQQDNYGCSNGCKNLPGSASCACPAGLQLLEDWKTCEDIDECLTGELKCQYQCVNTNGSAHCTCPQNYQLLPDGKCEDTNECFKNNGGCSQLCINTDGGHRCQCNSPHVLADDGRSCKISLCMAPLEPFRGLIICDRELEEHRFYPVNTKCHVVCSQDTELVGTGQFQCQDNGEWDDVQFKCNELKLCRNLSNPDDGHVTPKSCVSHWKEEGELCYFQCNEGFVLKGKSQRICGPTHQWDPQEPPECVKIIEETVELECPHSVTTDLPKNKKNVFLKLPQPTSNIDFRLLKVFPSWLDDAYQGNFPSGVTLVTVRGVHPVTGVSKSCSFHVNVRDRFPPIVYNCPQPITNIMIDDGSDTAVVNWEEPNFVDNVGIVSVWKSREQGTQLPPGIHHVRYVARDAAGNTGNCGFSFQIIKAPKLGVANQAVPIGYNQQLAPENLYFYPVSQNSDCRELQERHTQLLRAFRVAVKHGCANQRQNH